MMKMKMMVMMVLMLMLTMMLMMMMMMMMMLERTLRTVWPQSHLPVSAASASSMIHRQESVAE